MAEQRDTVVVTGGSGMIGSALIRRLNEQFNVIGFDVMEPTSWPDGPTHIHCDLTSDQSVAEALEQVRQQHGSRIASVVHLAAYYDFSGEPSDKYEKITVQGTERLLRELGSFEVDQFAFSSTMLVHAPTEPGKPIDEDSPLQPKWDYPKSKARTEKRIHQHRGDISTVILRIAGVYDDRCHAVPLAHQIQRIYEHRLTGQVFPGDLNRGQAFIHLDDLVDALELTVQRRTELPEELVLLLGEPETLGYGTLQEEFSRLIFGKPQQTHRIPKSLAKTGAWLQEHMPVGDPFIKSWMIDMADDHYELDVSRARQSLDWEPKRRLREALPTMIESLKADPEAWYNEHKLEKPRTWKRAG